MIKLALLAACGGAIGAAGRYLVGVGATRAFGIDFPWGTLIVNVVGSLAMGLLIGWFALRLTGSESLRVFLAIGVLGGFTTFSAFSMDVVFLIERKAQGLAFLYAGTSVVLSVAALFVGLYLARQGLR
ncbi:MAG: fluoride efflux transporter CrcB [Hyphomicrobiaceae bacterium]